MNSSMFMIPVLALVLVQTCEGVSVPQLEWRPTADTVRIANGIASVSSKDSRGGVASATIDLTPYADDAVLISVRGEAKDVSLPPKPWNGVKAMLSFTDATTGKAYYPQAMNGRTGSFGPETFRIYCNLRGRDVKTGTLSLGLESVSGKARFDLQTLTVERPGNAEYTPRWKSLRQLKGVMLPHVRPPTEDDFATLKSWGAHLARFQMVRTARSEDDKKDLMAFDRWLDERMDWLDAALELGRKYGILLVVDMHSTPGGGSGATGNHRVFEPGPWAAHYLDAWRRIATRFRGRRGIYAFDLVNEPHNPEPRTEDCWNLQYKAAEIVRGIDPETPISIESEWGDLPKPFEWICPLPFTNIIYQVHMYAPFKFTHQRVGAGHDGKMDYPGTLDDGTKVDKEYLRRELQPVRDFQLRYGTRILVGEFSAAVWANGADKWLADAISIFNEYGWDWTYHAFREAGCWSLEHEGTSWNDIRPSADNPRKRAVLDGMKL